MDYQGNDIYCDMIIPGKMTVEVIKETDTVIAFYHTQPFWPVHAVVTPKRHVASVLSLVDEPELTQELLAVIKEVSEMIVGQTGACRVVTNLGEYQDSKHVHFHLSSGEPLLNRPEVYNRK